MIQQFIKGVRRVRRTAAVGKINRCIRGSLGGDMIRALHLVIKSEREPQLLRPLLLRGEMEVGGRRTEASFHVSPEGIYILHVTEIASPNLILF